MDNWQKEHIQDNLSELIQLTSCNTLLLSELVRFLSKDDEALLDATLHSKGSIGQAKQLYDIAVSKSGMYEALTKALFATKQTGAFQILLQGAMKHRPDGVLGVSAMNQQHLETALKGFGKNTLQCIVHFQGRELPLQEALENISKETIENLSEKYLTGNMLVKLIDNKKPTLINNSVPANINYYIPRRLTPRHRIDPAVFDKTCKDIFVIKHIQLHALSSLARNQGTDLSTSQKENLTVRFIVLEYEQHYDKICRLTFDPVHLLDYSQNQFIWVKTHGDISTLHKYISEDQDDQTEEKFLAMCLESRHPICISDTPGMGKTVLLASLANKIMQQHPKRIVRFLVLRELVPEVQERSHGNITEELLINIIAEQASEFEFGREVMKQVLKSAIPVVELIFDGFDEVLFNQVNTAKRILRNIANLSSVRVYVATRPHMRDELEKTLSVLGYNIEAFGLNEQVECLKKYWKIHDTQTRENRLDEYARHVLEALEKNMKDSERGIAGIPLQCKMLAEVYQDDAVNYSKPESRISDVETGIIIHITSIFDMYQKLVELRFQKIPNCVKEDDPDQRKVLTFAHMYAAVQLLFPEYDEKLKSILIEDHEVEPRELCKLGILEKKKTAVATPRFIHRTFAEYFLGLFVVQMFHYHEDFGWQFFTRNTMLDFFYNTVLKTTSSIETLLEHSKVGKCDPIRACSFNYSVICYFINAHLKQSQMQDAGKAHWTKNTSKLYDVLAACIFHNYPKLLHETGEPTTYPNLLLENSQVSSLTLLSAKYSDLELFKMMHKLIESYLCGSEKPLFSLSAIPEFVITPLHIAVERGNFIISEFIIKFLDEKDALHDVMYVVHCCVSGSVRDSPTTVAFKTQIIQLISKYCSSWINEAMPDGTTPLLQSGVHVKLLESLLKCGADANAVSNHGCVLHRLVEHEITAQNYYDLQLSLLKYDFDNFSCTDIKKRTSLHVALQKLELLDKSIQLFHYMKADLNAVDEQGDSIFLCAVCANRSINLLKTLIKFGCKINKGNYNHDSVFHISAKYGNFSAFEFFLESKETELSTLNFTNRNGMTPFLQALSSGKGLTVRLVNLLEEKGFVLTDKMASDGLKALICNRNIMAWEIESEFVRLADYLIGKGGVVTCRNETSPWDLEATKKSLQRILKSIQYDGGLLEELIKRGIYPATQTAMKMDKKSEQYDESMLADLRNIKHPSVDKIETNPNWSFVTLSQSLMTQPNTFERLCVGLVAAKQIQSFILLKQCLQSDLQESVKFVTPTSGLLAFIQSKQDQIIVVKSKNIELSTTRVKNTIDPDVLVITKTDLDTEIPIANITIFQGESQIPDTLQILGKMERKLICIFLDVNDDLSELDCPVLPDNFSWEDLSADFQNKINLLVSIQAETSGLPQEDHTILKDEQLSSFIHEKEQNATKIPQSIDKYLNQYLNRKPSLGLPGITEFQIEPLHIAVSIGSCAITEFLLNQKSQSELLDLKYLIHFCVSQSASDTDQTLSCKEIILELLTNKNKNWANEYLPTGRPPLLQSNVHGKLTECLLKLGADMNMVLEYGKGLTTQIIGKMEEWGLEMTEQLASETLKGYICNKNIMAWELDMDFVQTVDYLVGRGGRMVFKNGKSPWELEAIQKNMGRIADATTCNDALLDELKARKIALEAETVSSDQLLVKLKKLQQPCSFEKFCASLIACHQTTPYTLLKLCLSSDENERVKFITPPLGIAQFLQTESGNVAILESWDIELTTFRIKETNDSGAIVLTKSIQSPKQRSTNLSIFQCETATMEIAQSLAKFKGKVICVCSEVTTELKDSQICNMFDELGWEDLSVSYQINLNLFVSIRFEMTGLRHIDYKLLRNKGLVNFVRENSTTNLLEIISRSTDAYLQSIPTFFSTMIPKIVPTPFHVVIEKGYFFTTEFLLGLKTDSELQELKYLGHICVAGSITENEEIISNKIKIMELLSKRNMEYLNECLPDCTTPLLQSNIHGKLFECLFNLGTDVNAKDMNGFTPLIKAVSSRKLPNVNIIKLMEEKGLSLSKQVAVETLTALFSNRNTLQTAPDLDFVQVAEFLIQRGGVLTLSNDECPWESVVLQTALIQIVEATNVTDKLLEALREKGLNFEKEMEVLVGNTEVFYNSLKSNTNKNSFEILCISLILCNQIKPFMLLLQVYQVEMVEPMMFISPPRMLVDFLLSKHDCLVVIRCWDLELVIERIKDTTNDDVFLADEKNLQNMLKLATHQLVVYKCKTATTDEIKGLTNFKRKIICICTEVANELGNAVVHEDEINWKDLSVVLQADLLKCDADVATLDIPKLKNEMLTNFIRESLPEFTGFETKENTDNHKCLSTDIFQYFLPDKLVFYSIGSDELNKYVKYGHQIGRIEDDISKLDYILVTDEQLFEDTCKKISSTVHLIEHRDGAFRLAQTRGSDKNIQQFIKKESKQQKCDDFPVCTCGNHKVGSGNLIWNIYRYRGMTQSYWINILDLIENLKIKDKFILDNLSTIAEVIKLFHSAFDGKTSMQLWKQVRKSIGGNVLTNKPLSTTDAIVRLLKYIGLDEHERIQLQLLAVKMLLPKFGKANEVTKLEKCAQYGILEYTGGVLGFVHEILAWYFIADAVAAEKTEHSIIATELNEEILGDYFKIQKVEIKFYIKEIGEHNKFFHAISSFKFDKSIFFKFLSDILTIHQSFTLESLKFTMSDEFLEKWVRACIFGNHFRLLKLVLSLQIEQKIFQSEDLVVLAVMYAENTIIEFVVEMFVTETKKRVVDIEIKNDYDERTISLLHVAALRGSYTVMHYFLNDEIFKAKLRQPNMRNILAYCVYDTRGKPDQVSDRKRMIRLLLENVNTLINEGEDESWMSPLLADKIHFDLIIYFISLGVDVHATDRWGQNILNLCPKYITPQEYHELIQVLHDRGESKLFHARGWKGFTPLHDAVRHLEVLDSTLQLFSQANADFNAETVYGNTVMISAVEGRRSLRVLVSLIHYGADFHQRGYKTPTVLHVALDWDNFGALRYFISKGCDINSKDHNDNTPLHLVLESYHIDKIHDIVQILVQNGADVNAINKKQQSPLRLALKNNYKVTNRTLEVLRNAGAHV